MTYTDECPYSAEWDGCACGYIVCRHCHHPAEEQYSPQSGDEFDS